MLSYTFVSILEGETVGRDFMSMELTMSMMKAAMAYPR